MSDKHTYPSLYPPQAHWALAKAWKILDSVKPGVISDDIRAFLVGQIAGLLVTLKSDEDERLDPYYYARDHDKGPGAWCVRGPDGFELTIPGLDKSIAYIIGKLLSGKLEEADQMLHDLAHG